jgi:hypothetical protein
MNIAKLSDLNLLDVGNAIQMTGAIYSGNGEHYLLTFPEEHGTDFTQAKKLEMTHPEWETFLKQTDHLNVEVKLLDPITGQIVKAIMRKSQRQVDQSVSWAVYHRDRYKCRYCARGDGTALTVDHLVCWEEGGPSTVENLVSACRKCNRTRSNMSYPDWLASGYYKHVSRQLDDDTREANLLLVGTLDGIERLKYKRSR